MDIINFGYFCNNPEFNSLLPGKLLLLATRPMMGKTAVLTKVAATVSLNHPVLYVSLDDQKEKLAIKYDLGNSEILDDLNLSLEQLQSILSAKPYTLLVISYVQLLEKDSDMTIQTLKDLAVSHNLCVMLSMQLDRTCELRPPLQRTPCMDDVERMFKNKEELQFIDHVLTLRSRLNAEMVKDNSFIREVVQLK
jgi:replicative DNA helicase